MSDNSIFNFADKFGYNSPFGDWIQEEKEAREAREEKVKKAQITLPDPKKGRIVFDSPTKQIYVNILIVFYGNITEKEATQQAGLIDFACNEMPHNTIGPDGAKYPVCYNVNGILEKDDFAVKKLMISNHKATNYDDRLGFARILTNLKGGPHNDDEPDLYRYRRYCECKRAKYQSFRPK